MWLLLLLLLLLLQERTYWESELVAEAKEAFTTIFQEMSINGGMDATSMSEYMERVNGAGSKVTPLQVRQILERYHTNSDNRLSLEGFLQYHTEQAWNNHKSVWKDLHAFGYRNDLSRTAGYINPSARGTQTMNVHPVGPPVGTSGGIGGMGEGARSNADGGMATSNTEHLTNNEPGFTLPPLNTVTTTFLTKSYISYPKNTDTTYPGTSHLHIYLQRLEVINHEYVFNSTSSTFLYTPLSSFDHIFSPILPYILLFRSYSAPFPIPFPAVVTSSLSIRLVHLRLIRSRVRITFGSLSQSHRSKSHVS